MIKALVGGPEAVRFPWKFPESCFLSRGQISKRISRNLDLGQTLAAAPVLGPALSFAKFVSRFGWVRLSPAFFRDLGGPARKNERGQLSRNLRVSFRVADPWIQMLYPPT